MEQNQNKQRLEESLVEAQKDKIKSILKTAGWTTLPVVVLSGILSLGVLMKSQFENKDLGLLVQFGTSLGLGYAIGVSGITGDYIKKFKDFVINVNYASSKARGYRTQLQELE